MANLTLLQDLQSILEEPSQPEAIFSKLLPVLGEVLQCDRCFLYLRHPDLKLGRTSHCWRRNAQFPEVFDLEWKKEPESLPDEDPLFAAALQAKPSVFVEDVETADPAVVNRKFEHENFGHRALIHTHLTQNGRLWGILQPCIFEQPRVWTGADHAVIQLMEEKVTPLATTFVQNANLQRYSSVS